MLSILLAVVVVGLDQATKWLVTTRMEEFQAIPVIANFFSIEFVYNTGASFGMLRGFRWVFVLVALGAVVGMLWFLRQPAYRRGVMGVAMGLLMGGAVGNLIDRIRFGKVVDFLLFYWKDYHFPNFNVADIAINVGVGLLLLYLLITGEKGHSERA